MKQLRLSASFGVRRLGKGAIMESDLDTVVIDASRTVFRPDGLAAIVLTGRYPSREPFEIAFAVSLQTLAILRNEIAKAEAFLLAPHGRA